MQHQKTSGILGTMIFFLSHVYLMSLKQPTPVRLWATDAEKEQDEM